MSPYTRISTARAEVKDLAMYADRYERLYGANSPLTKTMRAQEKEARIELLNALRAMA